MNSRTEILYVSSAPDAAEFARIGERLRPGVQPVTYGMAEASFRFHSLIQEGLLGQGCRVHSLVGRGVSRRFHRGHFWRRVRSSPRPGLTVDHLATPAYWGLKQMWLAASCLFEARRWERRTRGAARRAVIVDGAYVTVFPGVLWALRGSDVVRVGIFADLYSYMADVRDASDRSVGGVHALLRRLVRRALGWVDGFVVLTQAMDEVINVDRRPSLVMEGLVADDQFAGPLAEKSPQPTVAYLGALRREYGLDVLVEGFLAWDRPDSQLVIFGQGEYAAELAEIAQRDPRVIVPGPVPLSQVAAEEQRAWLLVNPRPADQEFTKYSFPSKNMEYLASGTPLLTTRLPGMPPEYLDYVLTIDESGAAGVTGGLDKAFAEGRDGLSARGERGRRFVQEQKNNVAQAGRILELVKRCAR